jgi:hypothetical protein
VKMVLTSAHKGKLPGDTVDVDEDEANWLISQGYAYREGDTSDKTLMTGVPGDKDPTLAANQPREDAPSDEEPKPHEVFANLEEDGTTTNIVRPQRLGNESSSDEEGAQDEQEADQEPSPVPGQGTDSPEPPADVQKPTAKKTATKG